MTSYSYVVAKFVPDMARDEPINIGVLVYSPDTGELYGKFIENFQSVSARYHHKVNINFIKDIVEGFRSKHKIESENYLLNLAKDFQYNLRFTTPGGIVERTPEQALEKIFGELVGVEVHRRKIMTRLQLRSFARKEIVQQLEKKWVIPMHPVKGPKDDFHFDFAFKNGKVSDLLHAISFEGNAKNALILAKALALTLEYATAADNDLKCTALVQPPTNEKIEKEFYFPAIGYLEDKKCMIKTEHEIPQYVMEVKRKLSKSTHSMS